VFIFGGTAKLKTLLQSYTSLMAVQLTVRSPTNLLYAGEELDGNINLSVIYKL